MASSVGFMFWFVFFFSMLHLRIHSASPSLSDVQLEALVALRDSISEDPLGALANWSNVTHHCSWYGITCDSSNTTVQSISLFELQLRGTISPFIGNISTLQMLDLTSNSFFGHLPAQIGLCSELTGLSVSSNLLWGPIPPQLGNLKMVQILRLESNFFNGSIPGSICNCTSLSELSLHTNNLTGQLPSDIGKLVTLGTFLAYQNQLVQKQAHKEHKDLSWFGPSKWKSYVQLPSKLLGFH
ncbi:hypothetical protein Taro_037027 [Colocasia esculenta]|uniref:Leucine-rich repeat-containing N-terminal plant-type domain-containing protein n=1 Tax=Colocasia esculenta TaxID=4460 RepID=A0A843W330_COLES|nr:hypothetical protein [Colocasia esculenta]